MNKEQIIKDFINCLHQDIQSKNFLTYQEQEEWKDYINRVINNQVKEKDKEIERLNRECDTYMKIVTKRGNIITELEKYLENEIRLEMSLDRDMVLRDVFTKLLELKDK